MAVKPTNEEEEIAKGRIAVWLDSSDILWLARYLASVDIEEENVRIGNLRFRLLTSLHKAGLPNDPFEDEVE